MVRFILIILTGVVFTGMNHGQNGNYENLKALYQNQNYIECYQSSAKSKDPYGLIFQALSFHRMPDNEKLKKEQDEPLLYTLNILKKANKPLENRDIKEKNFFREEIREVQQTIFEEAKRWYNLGRKKRAEEHFDAMHKTFDSSNSIFINHYGFNDDHFLKTLRSNVIQEEENEEIYSKEIEKLIDKHYHQQQEELHKWDNPRYRLANSAKDEEYLTDEEKMIYYYLNLVRMNPDLFLQTFIKPRLHVKYHGEIEVMIPVYDTLKVENYNQPLTKEKFYNLPVHRIYMNELPKSVEEKFIEKTIMKNNNGGQRFRFNINYTGLYNYLSQNQPELLTLENVSKFTGSRSGKGLIRYKLYDENITYYNRTYEKEVLNSYYYMSLFRKLAEMKPRNILKPNHQLFKTAECWAIEAGERGLKGHDRINCRKNYNAEACDYGNDNGFEVVLNLLVDKFVPSLGHRKILLGNFSELGAAIRSHNSDLNYNAVLDFNQ
ncbi:MAG: hypothetical protein ACOCTM_00145 [Bacteroidota bacterium]